jgi:hypothetical protein
MFAVFCKGWDYEYSSEIHGYECFDTHDEAVAFIEWCKVLKADNSEYGPYPAVSIWKFSLTPEVLQ